jgi:hypothetical protein
MLILSFRKDICLDSVPDVLAYCGGAELARQPALRRSWI